jgi:hypothetical protein
LKPETIGIIYAGGYPGNVNYRQVILWLLYKGQTDGNNIQHARKEREIRLPKLPRLGVDGYCPETKTL